MISLFKRRHPAAWLRLALLGGTLILLALRFVHLSADFPNDSPWMDWAKYTDEGWYSDGATRHFLQGHALIPGDFNPAVAMPVWPLMEGVAFHFTGVSMVAARALAVCAFAVALGALFLLMERFPQKVVPAGDPALAAPVAVFLLAASPFTYVFSRMAILEPVLLMFTLLALLGAARLRPWRPDQTAQRSHLLPALALGCLLAAMVLTKPTALALLPGIGYMLWHRAGHRLGAFLRIATVPVLLACLVWGVYFLWLVRPHLEDYRYLFASNSYTSFQMDVPGEVIANTFQHSAWMGASVVVGCNLALLLLLFSRPVFFRNPLVVSFLLMLVGYFLFLAYHNNFQPRYYLVAAVPITALLGYALEAMCFTPLSWNAGGVRGSAVPWGAWLLLSALLLIAGPDLSQQVGYILHPEYTFVRAAAAIRRIVLAEPHQSKLLLSISGSDLSLMTGLPSINDDFGTLDLDHRVRLYRPGWYLAWNSIADDKMDAFTPAFRPIRVASFPALDDPERNQLLLYRLDALGNDTLPAQGRRPRVPLARQPRGRHHGKVR